MPQLRPPQQWRSPPPLRRQPRPQPRLPRRPPLTTPAATSPTTDAPTTTTATMEVATTTEATTTTAAPATTTAATTTKATTTTRVATTTTTEATTTTAKPTTTTTPKPAEKPKVTKRPAPTQATSGLSKKCRAFGKEAKGYLLKKGTGNDKVWRCAGGWCIPAENRCNGWMNCGDASDEKDCPAGTPKPKKHVKKNAKSAKCSKPWFEGGMALAKGSGNDDTWRCKGGWCVPAEHRCNGVKNCGDGSDEQGC